MSKRKRWGTGKGLRRGSVLEAASYRRMASALPKDAQPRACETDTLPYVQFKLAGHSHWVLKKKLSTQMIHPQKERESLFVIYTKVQCTDRGPWVQEVTLHPTPMVPAPPLSCQKLSNLGYKSVQKHTLHHALRQPSSSLDVSVKKYWSSNFAR